MNKCCLLTLVLIAGCAGPAPRSDEPVTLARNPYCLHDTGSRIATPPGSCVPAAGRSYTREEIEDAGGPTLVDALQRLVPF